MIDRGALVLAHAESQRYRGARRASLDGMGLRGSGSGALKARYREAVVAGEGVVEDLDEAIDMADHARRLGATVDVVVFEVPQGAAVAGALPVVSPAPAEGLTLLGWDVLEPIEPFWSPLAAEELHAAGLNAHGLFDTRAAAESFAAAGTWDVDEPLVAARIWLCPSAG
jgi:hypothetical protein